MQVIYSRASNMMSKPRYQSVALPLICASSAASPEEALLANFSTCIEACITRLKEKSTRNVAFYGICQLLYAYLRRCHETHTGVSKRLDPIIRTIFPSSRKQLYPPDVSPDRIAVIPHLIFQHHYEYGNELVAGLLNPTPSISNDNWPPETLCFERMHCAIRALMYTLDVSESGRDLVMDSPPQELDSFGPPPPLPTVSVENLSEMFLSRGPYRQLVESSSATIAKIAMACNIACDNFRLLDDRNILQREGPAFYPQTPERDASHVQKRHGGFMVTYPREKQPLFDLLRICFDSWPRLLAKPHTVAEFKPAEILIQNLLHIDLSVYHSARKALERLTKQPDGHTYLCALTRSVAKPDLVLRETSSLQGANTVKLESLVGLWSELVEGFCQQLEQVASTQPRPMPGFGAGARRPNAPSAIDEHATAVLDGVNPQQLTYILPELEGTAMVLSVSSSNLIRRRASDVLRLIVKIHSALSAWSMAVSGSPLTEDEPRVLTTLGDSASHLLSEIEVDLVSSTEKTRLNHWKEQCTSSGQAPTDAILQIIAGNHSVDHSIWHHLLPRVFNHLADACPIFISIARPLFVVRHLAVYPTAAAVAGLMTSKATVAPSTMRNGTQYSPATSDTRFLADHWKTHLVVLCATMPAQNTQTVTPAPVDGAQIDPDRLKTGPEIVKLAVPFLASDESLLRDASVIGLGCMSADAYRSLLEGLSHIILHLVQEHQRRAGDRSAMRRSARNARLHLSVASVQEVASKLLRAHQASDAEVGLLSHYIRETLPIVRETDPNEAALRRAFSICTMNIIDYCGSRGQLKRWFASDIRQQLFALFRTWSFLPLASQSPELRQHKRGESGVSQVHSSKNRSGGSGSLPVHDVFMPSVKAIAALCVCFTRLINCIR